MANSPVFLFVVFFMHGGAVAERCYKSYYYGSGYSFYCYNGCCGSWNNQYCCSSLADGAVAGIVIGSIVLVGLVFLGIYFCCRQNQRKIVVVGHVLPGTQVQTVSSNTVLAAGTQPPSYPTHLYPPNIHQQTTSFSTGNSAFPTAPSQNSAHEKSQPLPPPYS